MVEIIENNYLYILLGGFFAFRLILWLLRRHFRGLTDKMNRRDESARARDEWNAAIQRRAFLQGYRTQRSEDRAVA